MIASARQGFSDHSMYGSKACAVLCVVFISCTCTPYASVPLQQFCAYAQAGANISWACCGALLFATRLHCLWAGLARI